MSESLPPPDACQTMAQVRAGIDDLDTRIVAMLATRFAYMRAAARIKPDRAMVRDEDRKAAVIANARAEAEALGLPADAVADLWDGLVEASIAYELAHWEQRRQG
jgi:isochorismate pyruvate lyase